jgi:hypothetical protein
VEQGRLSQRPLSAFHFPLYLLLQSWLTSVVLTWPTVLRLGEGALGSPHGDNLKHLWNLWVTRRIASTPGGELLHNQFINHPEGLDLWPIELLHSGMALVLPWLSLVVLSNLQVLLNLTLDGLFMGLLAREVSGSRLAACAAALLLQGSSFALFAVEVGVGELQHLWILPLAFWSLLRLSRSTRPGWIPLTAGILALAPLACFYHGLFVAIGCAVLALFSLARAPLPRPLLARFGVVAALAIGLALIPLQMFSSSYGDRPDLQQTVAEHVLDGRGSSTNPLETRLQLSELVTGGHAKNSQDPKEQAYGGGRLLGIPLVLLVLFATWRDPRRALPWLVVSGVALLLAMGPYPTMTRGPGVLVDFQDVPLPFLYLNRALGFYNLEIHFPARFMALAQVGLVVVASVGVARLSGRLALLGVLLAGTNVIDVFARGVVPHPLSITHLPDMSTLDELADHEGHALLDLSYLWLDNLQNRHTALVAQMHHGHPVNTIALERVDRFGRQGLERTCALRLPHKLHADFLGLGHRAPDDLDFRADFFMLQQWGFEEIMIALPAGNVPARLAKHLGSARVQTEDLMIWPLPKVNPPAFEADTWMEEYKRRLDHVRKNGCPFDRTTPAFNASDSLVVPG